MLHKSCIEVYALVALADWDAVGICLAFLSDRRSRNVVVRLLLISLESLEIPLRTRARCGDFGTGVELIWDLVASWLRSLKL